MRNKSHLTSFKKYQMSYRNLDNNKFLNNNYIGDNLSFEMNEDIYNNTEIYPNQFSTIDPEISKIKTVYINYHPNQGKLGLSYNRDSSYRNYYEMPGYQTEDCQTYDYYNYQNLNNINSNVNSRQITQYSQSIDEKPKTAQKNIKKNNGEKRIASNYSYYESKYSKNYGTRPNNNNKSNNIQSQGAQKIINLNKGQQIINKYVNNRYNFSRSPTLIMNNNNEPNYYKLTKEKFNSLNNSTSGEIRKKVTFQHTYKTFDNHPLFSYKSKAIKSIVQPRTPSSLVFQKMQSPMARFEGNDRNNHQYLPNITEFTYNKSERNIPSKNLEKFVATK